MGSGDQRTRQQLAEAEQRIARLEVELENKTLMALEVQEQNHVLQAELDRLHKDHQRQVLFSKKKKKDEEEKRGKRKMKDEEKQPLWSEFPVSLALCCSLSAQRRRLSG